MPCTGKSLALLSDKFTDVCKKSLASICEKSEVYPALVKLCRRHLRVLANFYHFNIRLRYLAPFFAKFFASRLYSIKLLKKCLKFFLTSSKAFAPSTMTLGLKGRHESGFGRREFKSSNDDWHIIMQWQKSWKAIWKMLDYYYLRCISITVNLINF